MVRRGIAIHLDDGAAVSIMGGGARLARVHYCTVGTLLLSSLWPLISTKQPPNAEIALPQL